MTANSSQAKAPNADEENGEKSKQYHINKRLAKKREAKDQESEEVRKANEALAQENELLRKKLNPTPTEKPTLAGCGNDTEVFEVALNAWYNGESEKQIDSKVKAALSTQQQHRVAETRENDSQSAVDSHYEKVQEMKDEGYDQAEANAIEWLGEDTVKEIIAIVDNSPETIKLLGSNKEEADALAATLKQNPTRATADIGRLSARAGKFDNNGTPLPDEQPGGGNLPVSDQALKRRHDDLVEKARKGEAVGPELRKVRAEMREKGLLT